MATDDRYGPDAIIAPHACSSPELKPPRWEGETRTRLPSPRGGKGGRKREKGEGGRGEGLCNSCLHLTIQLHTPKSSDVVPTWVSLLTPSILPGIERPTGKQRVPWERQGDLAQMPGSSLKSFRLPPPPKRLVPSFVESSTTQTFLALQRVPEHQALKNQGRH